ncbi:DEAD/DEAH box helicase [Halosimplex salinum]|uniref:DEAD/DEAH box helicase n=1 Tax=Halosimplex salinum TaxID=1710538 RepID=UPI000F46CCAF|nr:DEAD/DEAH box helicase [Halosimplex salinum]
MPSPLDAFTAATDRASEITWWNRKLTKLNRISGVTNAPSFVSNELVDTKGPYLEFVSPPATTTRPATELLDQYDYDDRVVDAIVDELFGGDQAGSLYQHQAETIEAIETDSDDNILAVPTATGKTESFFFPLLNDCVSTNEDGLKAIINYPMKTLGVDQLNRFLRYIDTVNQELPREDRVTIGIWDRDTPAAVGPRDFDLEIGANIRGLECPRTQDDLRVTTDGTPGSESWTYPWLKITREQIRDGVDILLTNPEALDYMFVSDNEHTRDILGQGPEKSPVQHVVFDEAHVWSGISGSSIGLLIRRLKQFYAAHDPQVTLVSATIENPSDLASVLTGTNQDEVNEIGFTARDFPVTGTTDFDRFAECSLRDIVETLVLTERHAVDRETFCDSYPQLTGAVTTLEEIGLLAGPDPLNVPDQHRDWVFAPIADSIDTEQEADTAKAIQNGGTALGIAAEELDILTEQVVEHGDIGGRWFQFIRDTVPEVATLASWFMDESTTEVEFEHYADLVNRLEEAGASNPDETVSALLALGRAAGMVTAKYHMFAKPPRKIYWCQTCEEVIRGRSCPEGHQTRELRFCRTCHHPFVEVDTENENEDEDEEVFQPVYGGGTDGPCPGCSTSRLRLTDITVPTPTLLSFMLTSLCRSMPSEKTLVFSDSRSTAESVSNEIIGTEYGLTAETLYVKQLIEEGGQAEVRSLFYPVVETLREQYWQPLQQNTPDRETDANDILVELWNEIEPNARLSECQHLREAALVTPAWVYTCPNPKTAAIGHEVFNLFVTRFPPQFQKHGIQFKGYTRERLVNKLESETRFTEQELSEVVDDVLQGLLDSGVLEFKTWDDVRSTILNAGKDEATEDDVFEYIEDQIEHLEARDGYGDVGGGIFVVQNYASESDLQLVPRVTFCDDCYTASPVPRDGDSLDHCPTCGNTVDVHQRFRVEDDGSLTLLGWADIESDWEYPVDHWGHDLLSPLIPSEGTPVSRDEVEALELDFITVGIHKGDVPPTLRSAIEEGFRKSDPDVNIVSATPTMELGVDIGALDSVAQVGIPPTLTNYVQRSGRTGRTRGSESLVATTVRGTHPVDAHYYDDLDRFFGSFDPVRVPEPFDFDEILAGHVVTEVVGYLARNPQPGDTFEATYRVDQSVDSVAAFADRVEANLDELRTFVRDDMADQLRDHIEGVFRQRGLEVFDEIFSGAGPVSFRQRTQQTCSQLRSFSGSTDLDDIRNGNDRLDFWLNRLGYLANYREFGQQFPVQFEGSSESISFQGDGRLYDFYPGEENERGAVMTLYGSTYLVSDVEGTQEPLQTVAICTNDDCTRPFESYRTAAEQCPHCGSPLDMISIHGVQAVSCRKAYQFEDQFSTSPIMTTHVAGRSEAAASDEAVAFGLTCDIAVGSYDVIDFIPAFERRHAMGSGKDIKRSEARIPDSDTDDARHAPVGNQYATQGITLRFEQAEMADRLPDTALEQEGEAVWPQLFISLEQALTKAVAVETQSDQDDFRVKVMATDDEVCVYIVDNRQGGNGIATQVDQHLDAVVNEAKNVIDCDECSGYCENCLLIDRTPATYLDNDLLNRTILAKALGQPA